MAKRDIVVIGASVGGVQALQELVHKLPADYPGTIFIVLHTGPASIMPELLSRAGKISAQAAENGVAYKPNNVYVAPPNKHLLILDGMMKLDSGPRENSSRPSIDPLFRTAARTHRERVVGVILSGTLDDGSAGLFAVKARGGITIVQDPSEAVAPEMPLNAMRNVKADHCVRISQIPALLVELAATDAPTQERRDEAGMSEDKKGLVDSPGMLKAPPSDETQIAQVCPECGGALYEQKSVRAEKKGSN